MIPISREEIESWRVEVDQAERYRDEQLGKRDHTGSTLSAENIDYFDYGLPSRLIDSAKGVGTFPFATINVVYPIVKNVIPTLYYKNPYILTLPKRKSREDELSAPYAGAILNHYHKELDIKSTNKQIVFDAYVLGMGICKVGYTTKFGSMPTEKDIEKEKKEREKEKERGFISGIKEALGLKQRKEKEEETVENPELNEFIKSESPYVIWISPFDFGIDPAATDINNARYVYHKITKLLSEVKADKNYRNTSGLKGSPISKSLNDKRPETQLERFKTIDIFEIHYKTPQGINVLTLAADGERSEMLRHDENVCNIDGFQFEILYFNKHNHSLYPRSDIDIIKGLQDRINTTLESILNQVDKYVPKLLVDETGLSQGAKTTLEDGDIGSIVYTTKNPNEIIKEASFTQLKADLMIFIDKLMEIIMLETGLTKAQLMGMTSAQTATEAQIGQAGQNLRMSDKFDEVSGFLNRQSKKLWQIVQQFVDMEEISLITGESGVDEATGLPKYSWLPDIDSGMAEKLSKGDYRFEIEVGATEKPDLAILRRQIENLVNILGGPGVLEKIEMQGYKIELVEILREYFALFPNMFKSIGRVIKPLPPQQPMMPQGMPNRGGGQGVGAVPQMLQRPAPNMADIVSSLGGEKGQESPIA